MDEGKGSLSHNSLIALLLRGLRLRLRRVCPKHEEVLIRSESAAEDALRECARSVAVCFDMETGRYAIAGAKLVVEHVPVAACCQKCGVEHALPGMANRICTGAVFSTPKIDTWARTGDYFSRGGR